MGIKTLSKLKKIRSKPKITILDSIHCRADKRARKLILPLLRYESTSWIIGVYGHKKPATVTGHLITGRKGSSGMFLTGLLPRIIKKFKTKINISNKEMIENIRPLNGASLKNIDLRVDQKKALRKIRNRNRGVILMPTGSGKTIVALGIMSMFREHRILFLCHTKDLIEQTKEEIKKLLRIDPFIISGGYKTKWQEIKRSKNPIVIATIQSFSKLAKKDYMCFFDITIIDECFAKNTLVAAFGKEIKIQDIRIGNKVWAQNKLRTVTHTFKVKVALHNIIKMTFSNGSIIFCTKNELFLINNKWEEAHTILNKKIFHFAERGHLHEKIQIQTEGQTEDQETKTMSGMQTFIYNKKKKWNFTIGRKTWWKWAIDSTTEVISKCFKLAYGNCNQNREQPLRPKWVSTMLQSRYRKQKIKNNDRSRWEKAQFQKTKDLGYKENKKITPIRVANIEIYKQGSNDQSFRSIVGDQEISQGYVTFYDLEIEKENCYFANNILVHNCHHLNSLSSQYGQVMVNNLSPRRYGFTATIPTSKRETLVNEGLLGPIISELTVEKGINIGIIAKPIIKILQVPKMKLPKKMKYQEIYTYGIVKNRARNLLIVKEVAENVKLENTTTLIIIERSIHGKILKERLKKVGIKSEFVYGITRKEDRARIKNNLQKKKIKAVICSKVWKEGINIPSLNCIVNACGMKEEKATIQAVGRGLRSSEDKTTIMIVDFYDNCRVLEEHSQKRIRTYKKQGWL